MTSKEIRQTIIEIAAKCGQATHIGGALSMVECLNVLFGQFLNHHPEDPNWDDRDVFILSKGHAVLGYLATLYKYGYFTKDILDTFQQNGSDLIAHPVKNIDLGIESSNGSLGQGLSFGLGLALGFKKQNRGNRKVAVMLGDGECNEGSVWESVAFASEIGLDNLYAIVDENHFRNDGENFMYTKESGANLTEIWRSFGWYVMEVDGNSEKELSRAYQNCLAQLGRPSVIIAKTVKGKGISFMENNNDWHHNRVTPKIYDDCIFELKSSVNGN